jgi:hypothetical protein
MRRAEGPVGWPRLHVGRGTCWRLRERLWRELRRHWRGASAWRVDVGPSRTGVRRGRDAATGLAPIADDNHARDQDHSQNGPPGDHGKQRDHREGDQADAEASSPTAAAPAAAWSWSWRVEHSSDRLVLGSADRMPSRVNGSSHLLDRTRRDRVPGRPCRMHCLAHRARCRPSHRLSDNSASKSHDETPSRYGLMPSYGSLTSGRRDRCTWLGSRLGHCDSRTGTFVNPDHSRQRDGCLPFLVWPDIYASRCGRCSRGGCGPCKVTGRAAESRGIGHARSNAAPGCR